MRSLHGADRWRSYALVRDKSWRCSREENHDDRSFRAKRAIASASGSLFRSRRLAMRLLHAGDDHVRSGVAQQESESQRAGNHSLDGRKYLPVRNLSSNRDRHPQSRAGDEGRWTMSKRVVDESIEVERYELFAEPEYAFNFDVARRDFFKLLGGGLVMVFALPGFGQESGQQGGRRSRGDSTPKEIGGWLHIDEAGVVTVYTGKVEFGQNIRTSLSQAVAEELRVPISSIRMTMGDTDLTPYDMGTFG